MRGLEDMKKCYEAVEGYFNNLKSLFNYEPYDEFVGVAYTDEGFGMWVYREAYDYNLFEPLPQEFFLDPQNWISLKLEEVEEQRIKLEKEEEEKKKRIKEEIKKVEYEQYLKLKEKYG